MVKKEPDELSNFNAEKSRKNKTYEIDSNEWLGAPEPDELSNFNAEKSKKNKTYQIDSNEVLGALEHVDEAFSEDITGARNEEQAIMEAARKRKRFQAGTTKDFYIIYYVFVTVAMALCLAGLFNLVVLHNKIFTFYFVAAFLTLILPIMIKNHNITRFVIITPDVLMMGKGDSIRSIGWQEIDKIREIRKNRKHFRWTIITDKYGRSITFSSMLFPRFDLFMSVLRVAQRFYEEKTKETDTAI
ncbi:MAG: hypothetical protein AB9903_12840 [Vulcanimicrobiota bacterium]